MLCPNLAGMSDKNNTPRPDRAGADDFDVPTYAPDDTAKTRPAQQKSRPDKSVTSETAKDKAAKSPKTEALRDTTAQPGSSAGSGKTGGSTRSSATEPAARGTEQSGDNLYTRTGRAAPQNIPPRQSSPAPETPQAGAGPDSARATQAGAGGAETTAFAAAGSEGRGTAADDRNSEPLRSDAPTTAFDPSNQPFHEPDPGPMPASDYADTDFAPTAGSGAGVAQPDADQRTMNQQLAPDAPAAGGATAAGAATVADGDVGTPDGAVAEPREHRRGTIDWGILLIRLLLGVVLVLTSVATFFQLGGAPGLSELEAEYGAYVIPQILAIGVPSVQLAAGVFLIFGLITPLFAALATIVTSFTALHALADSGAGLNVFAWDDSVLLSVILLGISLVLQFTGPGLYSFDFGRRWARRPLVSSWIFVVLAIAGAVALWWFGAGVNPLN